MSEITVPDWQQFGETTWNETDTLNPANGVRLLDGHPTPWYRTWLAEKERFAISMAYEEFLPTGYGKRPDLHTVLRWQNQGRKFRNSANQLRHKFSAKRQRQSPFQRATAAGLPCPALCTGHSVLDNLRPRAPSRSSVKWV